MRKPKPNSRTRLLRHIRRIKTKMPKLRIHTTRGQMKNRNKWCYVEMGGCGRKQVIFMNGKRIKGKKGKYECLNCGKKFIGHPDLKKRNIQ